MITIKTKIFQLSSGTDLYQEALEVGGFESIVIDLYYKLVETHKRIDFNYPVCVDDIADQYIDEVSAFVSQYHWDFSGAGENPEEIRMAEQDDLFLFTCSAKEFSIYTLKKNNLAYSQYFYDDSDFFVKEIREVFTPQVYLFGEKGGHK